MDSRLPAIASDFNRSNRLIDGANE